jgi:hypothetical protein
MDPDFPRFRNCSGETIEAVTMISAILIGAPDLVG